MDNQDCIVRLKRLDDRLCWMKPVVKLERLNLKDLASNSTSSFSDDEPNYVDFYDGKLKIFKKGRPTSSLKLKWKLKFSSLPSPKPIDVTDCTNIPQIVVKENETMDFQRKTVMISGRGPSPITPMIEPTAFGGAFGVFVDTNPVADCTNSAD